MDSPLSNEFTLHPPLICQHRWQQMKKGFCFYVAINFLLVDMATKSLESQWIRKAVLLTVNARKVNRRLNKAVCVLKREAYLFQSINVFSAKNGKLNRKYCDEVCVGSRILEIDDLLHIQYEKLFSSVLQMEGKGKNVTFSHMKNTKKAC